MSRNIPSRDERTEAIVLKRVNYGEADRILTLITPKGKISAIVKGVRKAKSKLAGGVEMFALNDVSLHQGRGEIYTVTSAKMLEYYGGVLKNYEKMMLAGMILKKVAAAEQLEDERYFLITRQILGELNSSYAVLPLIEAWFLLNFTQVMEPINLYRDNTGNKLKADVNYEWDVQEKCFIVRENGRFEAEAIKFLRIMVTMDLETVRRVKTNAQNVEKILNFAKIVSGA